MKKRVITQIGSLPYENVSQAVEYSLRHDIPFLPELPKLGDSMLDYIQNPGKLSCLEAFRKHRFSTVKIQCVGPATLIMSGYSEDEAISKIIEHLSVITDLNAEEIIGILDEPALGQAGFNFQELWAPIFGSFRMVPGVHCCGNMDWDVLLESELIKIISYDASQYDITIYPRYRNGKIIAWGIEKIEDVKDFQDGDLLTLPCGMSPLKYTISDCGLELNKLKQISKLLI